MRHRATDGREVGGSSKHLRGAADGGRFPCRGTAVVVVLVLAATLLLAGTFSLLALAGPVRWPRTFAEISRTLAAGPHDVECRECHDLHAAEVPTPQAHALVGPNDNTFCDRCHTTPWVGGSYGGAAVYGGSAHSGGPSMVWPGPDPPGRTDADAAGKCLNCHDPHGWSDATGGIPHLALGREENLCFACHDGSPAATNVRIDMQKPFRHPAVDYRDRHAGPTESAPADFGLSPLNKRHAECEDCHDPHVARQDALSPQAPDASRANLGASRVRVVNGGAGTGPAYFFTPGADTLTTPVTEYQLCFKCHSSWTTQPPGQTDLGRVLNPANPSYHPVEARGRNAVVGGAAFTAGWSTLSLTRCGDCHGSETGSVRGPHGSIYRYILKAPYTASPALRTTTADELCFLCHTYDAYANSSSPDLIRRSSRFNKPGVDKGHAEHVGEESVPCYACHVTHGSTALPHLIVTGRNPGILSYTETATGGTCAPTCHGTESYTVNYAR